MLIVLAFGATGGMIFLSTMLGKRGRDNKMKDTAYECGMLPVGAGGTRMSVKFYLVAMLFILFDIEVVFMYPWAVVYKQMLADEFTRNTILGAMVSFLGILFSLRLSFLSGFRRFFAFFWSFLISIRTFGHYTTGCLRSALKNKGL